MKPNPLTAFWCFWPTRVVCALVIAIAIRLIVAILDGAGLPTFASRAIGLLIAVATLIGLGRIGWVQPGINGLNPPQPARGLLFGAIAGKILYVGIVLVAAVAGWYSVQSISISLPCWALSACCCSRLHSRKSYSEAWCFNRSRPPSVRAGRWH